MAELDLASGVRVVVELPTLTASTSGGFSVVSVSAPDVSVSVVRPLVPEFSDAVPSTRVLAFPVIGTGGGGGSTDHGGLTGLADDDHSQYHTDVRGDARYYTQAQVDTGLAAKSDTTHTHDGRYYTETESDSLLDGKSDTAHGHDYAATGHAHDDRYYTEPEADDLLAAKETPAGAQAKADAAEVDANTYTDSAVTAHHTSTSTDHDDRYYTEAEVDTALGGKANSAHGHAIADVANLQTELDGKSDDGHTHAAAAITYAGSTNLSATDVEAALDELDAEKPTWETSQRTVYVATTGSDITGDGTSGNPWATIQHAVNQARSIMQPVNDVSGYKVLVLPGAYVGDVTIPPTALGGVRPEGDGGIFIQSSTSTTADVIIRAVGNQAINAFGTFSLRYLTLESDTFGILVRGGGHIQGVVRECDIRRTSLTDGSSSTVAIYAQFARVYSRANTGTAGRLFGYGLRAVAGAVIAKVSSQPAGATAAELVDSGGEIR